MLLKSKSSRIVDNEVNVEQVIGTRLWITLLTEIRLMTVIVEGELSIAIAKQEDHHGTYLIMPIEQ